MGMLLGPKFGGRLVLFLIEKENRGGMLCLAEESFTGI